MPATPTGIKLKQLYTQAADTVLANATASAAVPSAVTLAEQTLLGRITGGHIDDLSVAQVKTLLAYAIGDLAVIATDTVLANNTAGDAAPVAIAVPAQTVIGRITGGHVVALTVAQQKTMLAYTFADFATVADATLMGNNTGGAAAPAAIAIAASTFVGRLASGSVTAMSVANAKTLLAYAVGDLAAVAANTIMANATAGSAVITAVAVAASTFVGRIASGNIIAMTVTQAKTLLAYMIGDLGTIATDTVVVNNTSGSAAPVAMSVPASTFVGRIATGDIIAMTVAQAQTLLACALLAGAIFTGTVKFMVGTATAGQAPAYYQGTGILLSAQVAGAREYDSINSYMTNEVTSGRGIIPVEQFFSLQSSAGSITTIANFFGTTSNIPLVASAYYLIEIELWFTKVTASTIVWTLTNSGAPTEMNVFFEMSPVVGVTAVPGTATMLEAQAMTTSAVYTITTASLSAATHYAHFKIWLKNNAGTSLKIQATATTGSISPLFGSYWRSRRLPAAASVGAFAS
jgi:hypothetical protein